MHLKESNVSKGGGVLSLEPPEDGIRNPQSTGGSSTSLCEKQAIIINNNNNTSLVNNNNINIEVCGKDGHPVLIIETVRGKGVSGDSQVVAPSLHGHKDGMSQSSPSSSLPDLSENGSCGSDRLHHPSISSGGPNHLRHIRSSSNCSLSSIDNDESDLESFSSLEVDISRADNQDKLVKEKEIRNLLDLEVLGYHSRKPSPCCYQESEGWTAERQTQSVVQINDLSPNQHTSNNNNINELTESGVKSFYDKPKLQLDTDSHVNNNGGDDNGNVVLPEKVTSKEICNTWEPKQDSAGYPSDDENPSDIEQKMAETKVKMNDAILSNGKEDLALHARKMKHYIKHKEMKENCGAVANLKQVNNAMKQPNSLQLSDSNDGDNRYTQVPESPIVDAYEKECLDVPEKMVRELENQSKESGEHGNGDDFIPCKKEKMEINEHKKCHTDENDNDEPSPSTPPGPIPAKRPDIENNKETDAPPTDKPHIARVTFSGIDEVVARRHDSPQRRREKAAFRKSVPQASCGPSARAKLGSPDGGEFDVYTMETAMPKIDWDAIEAHLKATKEEERRRRNDREEIRRKLAMGVDDDQFLERPYRKPSLHSRLQSGMNLQICFMNETASDCESQCSDTESTQDREIDTDRVSTSSVNSKASTPQPTRTRMSTSEPDIRDKEIDFFTRQAQLQAEARLALAQAKEMARMQMEIEKQQRKKSPIAEIVRESFNKIGVPFPDSKRRISRQILTDMNVAQLQVIANDLHTQIESLNEDLVTLLMERDDLHMEQDSMLVDIEDLTKHIGAKELSFRGSADKVDTKSSSTTSSPRSKSLRLKDRSKK